jgi:hypothetical protein
MLAGQDNFFLLFLSLIDHFLFIDETVDAHAFISMVALASLKHISELL